MAGDRGAPGESVDVSAAPATPVAEGTPPQAAAAAPAGPEPKSTGPNPVTIGVMAVVALIGVLLILASWRLWPFDSSVMATEDAYVTGRVTAMAPQVNGYVAQVLVRDYQQVRAGQPLIRIDDRIYRQRVSQARGQLDLALANYRNAAQTIAQDRANVLSAEADVYAARAELSRGAVDAARLEELSSRGSVSERERDTGTATLRAAEAALRRAGAGVRVRQEQVRSDIVARDGLAAQVATARAQLELARIDLANTVLHAPGAGQISDVTAREGQYLAAGSQAVYFVAPEIWVVANFKETQTHRMAAGQLAAIEVDALEGQTIAGRVELFAPATGSQFAVLKPDNASGNFTKVVQRVPVRIRIDPGQPLARRLRPGLSVIARVNTAVSNVGRADGPVERLR